MTGWAENASSQMTQAGYRRGGARTAVIELLDGQTCALSAYEIEAALEGDKSRSVGRASVYRVLDELEQLGLINRIEVGQGIARYEAAREDHHHHHLVCTNCGEIVPFEDEQLETAIHGLPDRLSFTMTEHEIVLRGTCSKCAKS
jgi:Fur family ferric uptake transcriptional regulator